MKDYSCQSLVIGVKGYRYCVPQRVIESAVQQYIERNPILGHLPLNGDWAFEWGEDEATGMVDLIVDCTKTNQVPAHHDDRPDTGSESPN